MTGTALSADLCVVGAGPAGLGLVRSLIGSGLRIVLLEGGNDRAPQELTDVKVVGEDPYEQSDISVTRAAFLGGTSGLWSYRMSNQNPEAGLRGCRYAPLDPIDFEERSEIPWTGWPFGRDELDPWYAAAQPISGLGRYDYSASGWSRPGAEILPLDTDLVTTEMFQFAPSTVCSQDAYGAVRADADIQILTEANVTGLDTDENADAAGPLTISRVRFARPDGSTGTVEARSVVLAAGGIENSRLLLLGGERATTGYGNAHDQVGRYWMEHPQVRGGLLVAPAASGLGARLGLYDAEYVGGTKVMAKLTIAPDAARKYGLVSTSALFLPRHDVLASAAVQAYTELRSPTGRGRSVSARAAMAGRMALGAKDLLTARSVMATQTGVDHNGWSTRPETAGATVFEILHQTEQSPDPDNRITLDRETDRFGRRIPVLHWRWTADDRARITQARDLYAEAFRAAGFGRIIQGDWENGQPRAVGGNHHHMGGTRISPTDRTGVVDSDLKVHGTANLFVAGSSVFPAGGSVNPTLTIVALSVRLAAHLRERLAT